MTNTIKFLASLDEATFEKAMAKVHGTDEAKARARKEVEEYKEMRKAIAKMFGK